MRWITRQNLHIDRTACAWLIRRFIDPDAVFVFVPADTDPATLDGHTFDMRGAEYSHEHGQCTFQAIVTRHGLGNDPALVEMGRIILDADVPPSRTRRPEAAGVAAVITGYQVTTPDDEEKLRRTTLFYEALYAYCETKIATRPPSRGTPRPQLSYRRHVDAHLRGEE